MTNFSAFHQEILKLDILIIFWEKIYQRLLKCYLIFVSVICENIGLRRPTFNTYMVNKICKYVFLLHFRYVCISKEPEQTKTRKTVPNEYIRKIFQQNTYFTFHIILHFFHFIQKLIWLQTAGVDPPPPFTDRSVTNSFFYAFPKRPYFKWGH